MDHNSTDLPQDQPDSMESRLKLRIRKQELDFEKQKSVASQNLPIVHEICIHTWINCVFVSICAFPCLLFFSFTLPFFTFLVFSDLSFSCLFCCVLSLLYFSSLSLLFLFCVFLSFFLWFPNLGSFSTESLLWICGYVFKSVCPSVCLPVLSVCLFVALDTYTKICDIFTHDILYLDPFVCHLCLPVLRGGTIVHLANIPQSSL